MSPRREPWYSVASCSAALSRPPSPLPSISICDQGIAEDDTFCFNVQFASKYRRVKVPLISTKETSAAHEEAAESVHGLVEEDRRHLVEAAVVRVMKARRSLSHNELVGEVVRQLTFRFNPNPQVCRCVGWYVRVR